MPSIFCTGAELNGSNAGCGDLAGWFNTSCSDHSVGLSVSKGRPAIQLAVVLT